MRLILQYLVFFCMFMTLSLVMHTYVLFHLSFMFGLSRSIWFWLVLFGASFSFMLGMGLRFMTEGRGIVSAVFIISSVWLGIMFLFMFCLMMYDITRLFIIELDPYFAGKVIAAFVGIASVYAVINARVLFTKEIRLGSAKFNSEVRIVHLSDLHIGTVHGPAYLKRIVEKTNALRPDVVLLTGDLADGGYDYSNATFAPLNDIKAPVFFTLGNHEYYAGVDEILSILGRTKLKILRNKKVSFNNIDIIGMDYAWDRKLFAEALKAFSPDPNRYTILMFHNPVGLEDASRHGIDLMLSGHTHGGQFFPIMIMGRMIWRYNRGLHRYRNSYIYTTTGAGTFGPPMRLGTNNEITLIRVGSQ